MECSAEIFGLPTNSARLQELLVLLQAWDDRGASTSKGVFVCVCARARFDIFRVSQERGRLSIPSLGGLVHF